MKIAILGCGPAGLMAAHAVTIAGHKPTILSRKVKSRTFGAMYLHRAIPEITPDDPELEITIIKSGCREGYAENVYGSPYAPVSWDRFEEGVGYGWRLDKAYDKLWDRYSPFIVPLMNIDAGVTRVVASEYELVMNTIPMEALCGDLSHRFNKQKIWVVHGPGDSLIEGVNDNDIMYYNGYTQDLKYGMIGPDWYRFSQINRYQSWEYSRDPGPDDLGREVSRGIKPLGTDCDCLDDVVRLGRFGTWDKNVFTHHAFEEASRVVQSL